MKKKYTSKYPLVWQKDDLYIEIFCSIPNIATGILLTTDKAKFVIDPGDGLLRDLNKILTKEEILEISDVFVTHGHHDHVGGVWSFLTYQNVMRRKKPIRIYYPRGCQEIISIYNAFREVYAQDILYDISLIEINDDQKFRRKNITIQPFKVNHREETDDGGSIEIPSLGFKYTYNGKSICYGGDTAYCDSLVRMAKKSDLAIIEAGAEDENDATHMTIKEAESIGQSAREYFLVHVKE
jgi:ribonuclease Z